MEDNNLTDFSEDSLIGIDSGFADETAYLKTADPNLTEYQILTKKFTQKELLVSWLCVLLFIFGYAFCYLNGLPYASLNHARIMYGIFVFINIVAAVQSFISWIRIPSRSIAKDAMLFFTVSMLSAAIGNSMDFVFWITNVAAFKQSVFTNLFFIFAILFALPGIHLLGRVCRVKFSQQPLMYYLAIMGIYLLIPVLMNASSAAELRDLGSFKEFIFGLLYAVGIGYMAAVSIHLWKSAQGRLVYSARLISLGTIAMSFGCSIYAGLFPRIHASEIPSSPVHIIIALGYVFCACGIKRTENTIDIIFNLKNTRLPPWLTLVELFGKSEGLDVYRRLEENIKSTLNELERAKEETQQKQFAISELEQEINLRKKIERDLIFAKEKAEEANRAKSHFLAMMSHELKTPLTAIKGYGGLLKGHSQKSIIETNRLSSVAEQIVLNADNLHSMIEGLLNFSQLESGQFTYRKEIFTIGEILAYIRSVVSEKQTSTLNNFAENVPNPDLKLETDRFSVQHIVVNLLTNAFKFCQNGSITLEIRKSGKRDLYIAVEDTGIGIPADKTEKIFQAFYQVSHGTRRKFGGTGLGLSIVKKITEEMNGTIHLDSEPGKRTRFEVFLPDIIHEEAENGPETD